MLTAIIGGSGLAELEGLTITHREVMRTEYGEPSGALTFGKMSGRDVVFLNRHGPGHTIAPHRVNYRANVFAMKEAGAVRIITINAVGGIDNALEPIGLVIPDQILDYTYAREHTYYDNEHGSVKHVYAATQGPRFETAAEINRMERDGATIVGMTGMPEAILAREMDLDFAMIAVVSNAAAGRSGVEISVDEIMSNLQLGMNKARPCQTSGDRSNSVRHSSFVFFHEF
jgi:purine nucleoside phosphorylase